MGSVSDERLKKMLEEGKISQEQYEEIRDNLPDEPQQPSDSRCDESPTSPMSLWERFKHLPLNLKICVGILVVSSGLLLILTPFMQGLAPVAMVSIILNLLIAYGLVNLQKWAFWMGMFFVVLSIVFCILGLPTTILSLAINVVFVVLLWQSKKYFET